VSYQGLASFEYDPIPELVQDVHLISTIPFYDLDDNDGSIIEPSIDILPPDPTSHSQYTTVDPASCCLYALDLRLQATKTD